jgi:hypothetical protein
MEDLFLALLSTVGEVLCDFILQLFLELMVGIASRGVRRLRVSARKQGPTLSAGIFALLGAIAGAVSLIAFPHPLFHQSKLHGISLLVSPLLTGMVMSGLGRTVQRRGRVPAQIESFMYGFTFAFALALIRFFFTR